MEIKPRNKIFNKKFLKLIVESMEKYLMESCVDDSSYDENNTRTVEKRGNYWSEVEEICDDMYKKYIDTEPKIIYNGDELYIRKIKIFDKNHMKRNFLSYKEIFNDFIPVDSLPSYCPNNCYDKHNSETIYKTETKTETEKINILPLDFSFIYSIKFNGTYFSGPNDDWTLNFSYNQNNYHGETVLNFNIVLGPKRRHIDCVSTKCYTGHDLMPVHQIDTKLVYRYMPDKLYFTEDIIPIIKNCISSNIDIFTYKDIKYKIIDYIFYGHYATSFMCGCDFFASEIIDLDDGLSRMPNNISHQYDFHYKCTPEWFLQVQFGDFQSHGYMSAKFILDIIN